MNSQQARTIQETATVLSPDDVIAAAKTFFGRRSGVYSAFLDKQGPGYVTFRGQGGEEIVIGVVAQGNDTRVTASTYLFDQQVARFLSELPVRASFVTAPVEATAAVEA